MRILVATHDLVCPIRGGGGLRTLKTAVELKRRGHTVRIIAPSDNILVNGIPTEPIIHPQKGKSYLLSALLYSLTLFWRLVKHKQDVVFVHNSVAGIPAAVYCKLFRKKLVYDATDIHSEYILANKKGPKRILFQILKRIEYWSFGLADTMIVVSKAMRETLVKNGVRNKIFVVYDGVELDDFSVQKSDSEFTIIHHGGIDEQDGVELIAHAAPSVIAKYPLVRFLIVGAGGRLERVKSIAQGNNSFSHFTFTGWKPYGEMKGYLGQADIGLILRPSTLANNTILTLKLLEYWGSGTAVISSRLKAIEEISTENRDIQFFQPSSSEDLSMKICGLLANRKLVRKMQSEGRKKAEALFAWKPLIHRIADFCEKAARNTTASA